MPQPAAGLFTVGVFADLEAAALGLTALARRGLAADALSVMALASPQASALIDTRTTGAAAALPIAGLGDMVAAGPLVEALQGDTRDLSARGLAGTMRRAGFQAHDARIFEALVARGGVLVAVAGDARASDALAVLHAYGAGNAAIGAWMGRL